MTKKVYHVENIYSKDVLNFFWKILIFQATCPGVHSCDIVIFFIYPFYIIIRFPKSNFHLGVGGLKAVFNLIKVVILLSSVGSHRAVRLIFRFLFPQTFGITEWSFSIFVFSFPRLLISLSDRFLCDSSFHKSSLKFLHSLSRLTFIL